MQENNSTRYSASHHPPIEKRNHNKRTRERYFPKRVQISTSGLLTMGELCQNEIELIYIYTKCPKTCLSTKLRVKHKIRGQKPLYFPFTKVILFNSYFSHKRNPRNMMLPFFWETFGNFGQVVEVEKGELDLQRPIVFKLKISSMIHGHLPQKVPTIHHHHQTLVLGRRQALKG
jgi:hypothetical protein